MLRSVDRLRAGALLLLGAAVVHEGRVLVEGHGGLARDPHSAVPFFAAAASVALLAAGLRFASVLRGPGGRSAPLPSLCSLWLACAAGLISVHLVQETLEGGAHQALAPATLVAAACALVVALGLALLLRGAERLVVARRATRSALPRCVAVIRLPAPRALAPRPVPLARHLAGRAPPPAA